VTAHTSSFSFKGKGLDIKTIASKLNVNNILKGSVQKSGTDLRISADLVNAETDATLWSNTYSATLNNIFALQDSISVNVAEALNAALLGKEAGAPEQKTDPEAYSDYLLGQHFFNLYGKENWEKAEEYYQKALLIDSSYAPALVGLSVVHTYQANRGYIPADIGNSEALKEVEKALELNPNLAEAYSRLGSVKTHYDWDWSGADECYRKALELEPANASAIANAAFLAIALGRLSEAITLQRRAIEINPVSAGSYHALGFYCWHASLFGQSMGAYRKSLELSPRIPGAEMGIARNYLEEGKPDSALVEMLKETDPMYQTYGLAMVYHALGRKKDSDDKLADLINGYQSHTAFQIAEVYAYRNENDKAFEWLERAYSQRDGGLPQLVGDPLLRNIVKDTRYTAFMKKMKLPF
jgi:tetratricopeptide (TPR) repeat protein